MKNPCIDRNKSRRLAELLDWHRTWESDADEAPYARVNELNPAELRVKISRSCRDESTTCALAMSCGVSYRQDALSARTKKSLKCAKQWTFNNEPVDSLVKLVFH